MFKFPVQLGKKAKRKFHLYGAITNASKAMRQYRPYLICETCQHSVQTSRVKGLTCLK